MFKKIRSTENYLTLALILIILLLFSSTAVRSQTISGKLDFWQKADLCSFDKVGDAQQKFGDISSVFIKNSGQTLFLRITFDDMITRKDNLLQKDNFVDNDIKLKIDFKDVNLNSILLSHNFDLRKTTIKQKNIAMLRTPEHNLLEIEFTKFNLPDWQNPASFRKDYFLM